MKSILGICAIIGFTAGMAPGANIILNGDFESNSAGSTQFNLSNAGFTSMMNNATGFGSSTELDIVTSTDFGIAPQSGSWKIGMHQNTSNSGNFDAFSLDLSTNVLSGGAYALSFWGVGLPGSPFGTIEIGLSNSSSSFGSLLMSNTVSSSSSWEQFALNFTASSNASYLTVRVGLPSGGYAFVDNFSLMSVVPTPTAALMGLGGLGLVASRRRRS